MEIILTAVVVLFLGMVIEGGRPGAISAIYAWIWARYRPLKK